MKDKYQKIIDEHVKLIVRNSALTLIVCPFVAVCGYVFIIYLAKEGFSYPTIGALVLFTIMLSALFINIYSIAKNFKTIENWRYLKENTEN